MTRASASAQMGPGGETINITGNTFLNCQFGDVKIENNIQIKGDKFDFSELKQYFASLFQNNGNVSKDNTERKQGDQAGNEGDASPKGNKHAAQDEDSVVDAVGETKCVIERTSEKGLRLTDVAVRDRLSKSCTDVKLSDKPGDKSMAKPRPYCVSSRFFTQDVFGESKDTLDRYIAKFELTPKNNYTFKITDTYRQDIFAYGLVSYFRSLDSGNVADGQLMRTELIRFASLYVYRGPSDLIQIARAGFFLVKQQHGNRIKCFACTFDCSENVDLDTIMENHHQEQPQCLGKDDSRNDPISEAVPSTARPRQPRDQPIDTRCAQPSPVQGYLSTAQETLVQMQQDSNLEENQGTRNVKETVNVLEGPLPSPPLVRRRASRLPIPLKKSAKEPPKCLTSTTKPIITETRGTTAVSGRQAIPEPHASAHSFSKSNGMKAESSQSKSDKHNRQSRGYSPQSPHLQRMGIGIHSANHDSSPNSFHGNDHNAGAKPKVKQACRQRQDGASTSSKTKKMPRQNKEVTRNKRPAGDRVANNQRSNNNHLLSSSRCDPQAIFTQPPIVSLKDHRRLQTPCGEYPPCRRDACNMSSPACNTVERSHPNYSTSAASSQNTHRTSTEPTGVSKHDYVATKPTSAIDLIHTEIETCPAVTSITDGTATNSTSTGDPMHRQVARDPTFTSHLDHGGTATRSTQSLELNRSQATTAQTCPSILNQGEHATSEDDLNRSQASTNFNFAINLDHERTEIKPNSHIARIPADESSLNQGEPVISVSDQDDDQAATDPFCWRNPYYDKTAHTSTLTCDRICSQATTCPTGASNLSQGEHVTSESDLNDDQAATAHTCPSIFNQGQHATPEDDLNCSQPSSNITNASNLNYDITAKKPKPTVVTNNSHNVRNPDDERSFNQGEHVTSVSDQNDDQAATDPVCPRNPYYDEMANKSTTTCDRIYTQAVTGPTGASNLNQVKHATSEDTNMDLNRSRKTTTHPTGPRDIANGEDEPQEEFGYISYGSISSLTPTNKDSSCSSPSVDKGHCDNNLSGGSNVSENGAKRKSPTKAKCRGNAIGACAPKQRQISDNDARKGSPPSEEVYMRTDEACEKQPRQESEEPTVSSDISRVDDGHVSNSNMSANVDPTPYPRRFTDVTTSSDSDGDSEITTKWFRLKGRQTEHQRGRRTDDEQRHRAMDRKVTKFGTHTGPDEAPEPLSDQSAQLRETEGAERGADKLYHSTECKEDNAENEDPDVHAEQMLMEQAVAEREEINEKMACRICFQYFFNFTFRCGHLLCNVCADKVKECPICRGNVDDGIHIRYSDDWPVIKGLVNKDEDDDDSKKEDDQ